LTPDFVVFEKQDRVGVITLNRPDALNAISGQVAEDLAQVFEAVAADLDVWIVLLRGAGEKAFSVGADLKERVRFSLDEHYENRKKIRGMFESLRAVPQPTIAAVFGFAFGGGFELALSCDLIVAAEGTQLGLPEVRVGLIPAGGGTQLLTRKVGAARAKELIFRGRRFDASEGKAMGLVVDVVPRDELDAKAMEMALDICRSSPVGVRAAKRAIDQALGVQLEDGIGIEHASWTEVIASEDRAEGIAAFNEKREPQWRNR
jgi:enoyl-CoA hydratase/carnithine racemase